MLFSNSLTTLPGDILFDNAQLEKVSSTKFLGLHIDEKLNWSLHCSNVCKVLSKNTGVIYKLRPFIPQEILLILYFTLILPY